MRDVLATRNRKLAAIAAAAVALVGVGTAIAASTLHSGSSSASATGSTGSGTQGAPSSGSGGRGFGQGRRSGGFSSAATYLGISQTQLFADIRSGKTLAQIATSTSGTSASGLIDAMVAAQKSDLESAVQSGRITRAMADQIEAALKSRVMQQVNGGFDGGFGRRGRFGPPGQSPSPSQSQSQPGTSPT